MCRKVDLLDKRMMLGVVVTQIVPQMMQFQQLHQHQIEVDSLSSGNLSSIQPALRHLIDFITVQHQVGCESVMLVKKDVLVLNGQKLVQGMVVSYAGVGFKTYSGLPFSYEVRKGRNGEYTKELWIDRREKSKSLAWSSVLLALKNIKGEVVDRPKALGDIRGVTYIYGMFYRFGLIDVPDEVKEKMGHPKDRKK